MDEEDTKDFIDYVMSFYGEGGIYDMDATTEEVAAALAIRLEDTETTFCADSFDRELIRFIILEEIRDEKSA